MGRALQPTDMHGVSDPVFAMPGVAGTPLPPIAEHFPGELKQFMQITESAERLGNPSPEEVNRWMRGWGHFSNALS